MTAARSIGALFQNTRSDAGGLNTRNFWSRAARISAMRSGPGLTAGGRPAGFPPASPVGAGVGVPVGIAAGVGVAVGVAAGVGVAVGAGAGVSSGVGAGEASAAAACFPGAAGVSDAAGGTDSRADGFFSHELKTIVAVRIGTRTIRRGTAFIRGMVAGRGRWDDIKSGARRTLGTRSGMAHANKPWISFSVKLTFGA